MALSHPVLHTVADNVLLHSVMLQEAVWALQGVHMDWAAIGGVASITGRAEQAIWPAMKVNTILKA